MISDILKETETKMQRTVDALKNDLRKVRTGRAHPSVLEHLMVDYYGNATPLSQVASVSIEGPRTLTVTPWEKTMIAPIEKAIMTSDLGLNPSSAGMVIRVPMPPLTEERRKSLVKVVRDEAEKSRISVRNLRRDANNDVKALEKEKTISEDDQKKGEAAVQKLTDAHVKLIDETLAAKEKDLMQV